VSQVPAVIDLSQGRSRADEPRPHQSKRHWCVSEGLEGLIPDPRSDHLGMPRPTRPRASGWVGQVILGGALLGHDGHLVQHQDSAVLLDVVPKPFGVPVACRQDRLLLLDQQPQRELGCSGSQREGAGPGRLIHGREVPASGRCSRPALLGEAVAPT
jgi:hypothetical protein